MSEYECSDAVYQCVNCGCGFSYNHAGGTSFCSEKCNYEFHETEQAEVEKATNSTSTTCEHEQVLKLLSAMRKHARLLVIERDSEGDEALARINRAKVDFIGTLLDLIEHHDLDSVTMSYNNASAELKEKLEKHGVNLQI